ncbi:hypothetical protein SDC9_192792 [bioreactor metagenome]|uniref:Uncharacterized protein n=1 Tax=bioreactor metagenome TaxID=1076179 RepID=A0A645I1S4_9ZZZZ
MHGVKAQTMKKAQHFILGAVPEHLHGKIRLAEIAGDACVHQVAAPVACGQQLFADTVPRLKQEDPAAALGCNTGGGEA